MIPARIVTTPADALEFIRSHGVVEMIQAGSCEIIVRPFKNKKSRDQEEKYHCQIADIARQHKFLGQYWHSDDMKRLLVYEFWYDTKNMPELAGEWERMNMRVSPSLSMRGVVMLGKQTRDFTIKLASAFIEWLYAWGAENNINWSEPIPDEYQQYASKYQ